MPHRGCCWWSVWPVAAGDGFHRLTTRSGVTDNPSAPKEMAAPGKPAHRSPEIQSPLRVINADGSDVWSGKPSIVVTVHLCSFPTHLTT